MGAMAISLDSEWLFKHYRIAMRKAGNSRSTMRHTSLSSPSAIQLLVDRLGEALRNWDKRVAGSVFIKRYSALLTGALYLWTHHDFAANLALNRLTVEVEDADLIFGISDESAGQGEQFLHHLFADNACVVIDSVSKYTKVSESILWAHLSYLLVYRFEEWLRNAKTAELRELLHAVYRKIMNEPSTDWFPEKTSTPLIGNFRSVEDPLREGDSIMIRSKCCLSYRLGGADRYCYTCPLISDACRIEKLKILNDSE